MKSKSISNARRSGRRFVAAVLSSSVVLLPGFALAQSPDDGNASTELKPITVKGAGGEDTGAVDPTIVAKKSSTATKTNTPILDIPASVSVVTSKEMKRRGVENLDDALSYTPGVSSDIYGSDNRYDHYLIRGFYETGKGSYRDGLPQHIWSFTGSRLEPYGMERIEVLKGSTSTLFGLNSPGGLVNAITKRPQDEKFGEVYTTFGEKHIETGTDFGGPLTSDGDWTYRVTSKWQNANAGIDHTKDNRFYLAPALTWKPDDYTNFTLLMDYNKRGGSTSHGIPYGSGIDPQTYLGEPDFDNMNTTERNIGYSFEHEFENGLTFRQNARYTDLDLTYESVYGTSIDPTATRGVLAVYGHSRRFVLDNQLEYDASFGPFDSRTLVGADYTHDRVRERRQDGTAAGINIYDPVYCGLSCISLGAPGTSENGLTARGIYAQEELTFDKRWILTLGGRYDHAESVTDTSTESYDSVDDAFTKRLGLTYKATDEISLYGNYSESFEPLSANRAFLVGSGDSQRGKGYEIGAKYQPEGFDALFTASLFDLTQTNVAEWNASYTAEYQVGKINVRGLELEAKMALNDHINLTAAYSYWDPKIEEDVTGDNVGKRPSLVPHHLASIWTDYTIPGSGSIGDTTVGVGVRFVGRTYADDANTIALPSRTVFDAALSYKLSEHTTLSVNATNLFDKKYVSQVDTSSNTAYYGDRRTVLGTLRYTW